MADDLVTQLARSLNLPQDAARHTLEHLVTTLREQLDAEGEAQVPGLGTFRTDDEGLVFHPDDSLARAVNHRYAGLRPIAAGFTLGRRQDKPEEQKDPFSDVSTAPSDAPHDEGDPPEATFQPIDAFIDGPSPGEEDSPRDELESDADPFEAAGTEAPAAAEPDTPEPLPTPAADEEVQEEEDSVSEQPDDAVEIETEETTEETDEGDPFAASWVALKDDAEDEHVLGPLPPDETEDAEFAIVEDEAEPVEDQFDEEDDPLDETSDTPEIEDETADVVAVSAPLADPDVESFDEDVESLEDDDAESDTGASLLASEPEMETEPADPADEPEVEVTAPEPSAEDEAELPVPAPPAPATAVAADRPSAKKEPSRSHAGRVIVGIVLLLCVAGIVWFLTRESPTPVAGERPVPADSSAVATIPPTDGAPADSAAATLPADASPATPAPPPDPLLGDAGVDPAAGGFTWVVASEVNEAAAERRVAQYREQGLRAGVVAQEAAGRTRYRVSLGQFDTIADAEARRADLPADVPSDSWILRLESQP